MTVKQIDPDLIMGIDPGFTGAIALYEPKAKKLLGVWDMPVRIDNKKRKRIDIPELVLLIEMFAPATAYCVLEKVSAMPGQGVTSMFRFGEGYGILKGVLSAFSVPFQEVPPATWKILEGLTHKKSESRHKADKLFPEFAYKFCRVKDDGRAEAALLAHFGERFWPLYMVKAHDLFH